MCQHCQVRAARASPSRKRSRRRAPAASDSEEDDSGCSEDETEDEVEVDAPAGGHSAAYAGAFLAYPAGHALAGSAPQEFGRELQFCCAGSRSNPRQRFVAVRTPRPTPSRLSAHSVRRACAEASGFMA